MPTKITKTKSVFAAILAIVMVLTSFGMTISTANAADTYSYTIKSAKVSGTTYSSTVFSVTSLGAKGLCTQPGTKAKAGKATMTKVANNSDLARVAYYGGVVKKDKYFAKVDKNRLLLARALALISGHDGTFSPYKKAEVKEFISEAKAAVKEAPKNFEVWKANPTNGSQNFCAWKLNPEGKITLIKSSTDSNSKASFSGIEYKVYESKSTSAKVVGILKCKADGTTNTLSVPAGTYYAIESKTNDNYELSSEWLSVTVKSSATATFKAKDKPAEGKVNIIKHFENDGIKGDFTFTLTNVNDTSAKPKEVIVNTNADGDGETLTNIAPGTYTVRETYPDTERYQNVKDVTLTKTVTVKTGETTVIKWINTIKENKPGLNIIKHTSDGGPVEGFKFEVKADNIGARELKDNVILKNADIEYKTGEGETLSEWKLNDSDVEKLNKELSSADTKEGARTIKATNTLTKKADIPDSVKDIKKFINEDNTYTIDKDTYFSLDGTTYKAVEAIERKTLDEIKELLKDDTKIIKIENSEKEISVDIEIDLKSYKDSEKELGDKTEKTEGNATWNNFVWYGIADNFYMCDENTTTNARGEVMIEHVPIGTYTVTEKMTEEQAKRYTCENPVQIVEVKDETETVKFNFTNTLKETPVKLIKKLEGEAMGDIAFSLKGKTVWGNDISMQTLTNEKGEIEFGKLPAGTYVVEETGFNSARYMNTYPLEGYENPAIKFTVTGEEEGTLFIGGEIKNGKAITSEQAFENKEIPRLYISKIDAKMQTFLPDAEFEILDKNGNSVIAFRIAESEEGSTYAKCELIGEPKSGIDTINGSETEGIKPPDSDYTYAIIRNLTPGETYTLKETKAPEGYSRDKAKEFTYEPNMSIVVENSSPEIGTTLVDSKTNMHIAHESKEVTLVDTVAYKGLTPGKEYSVEGILMRQATEEELASEDTMIDEGGAIPVLENGKHITSKATFTPDEREGTVEVTFKFNSNAIDTRKVVAFETLYDEELPLAVHADIEDENQTVTIPKIKTTAKDSDTNIQVSNADNEVTIIDTVSYEALIPGVEYEMTGTLIDKATSKPLMSGNKEITATKKFTPETSDGSVDIAFTFDGTALAGTTAVAFEKLSLKGKFVGSHEDPEDPAQTVYIPKLGTKASLKGKKVTDIVAYKDLLVDQEYIVKGQLMDKKTGDEIEGATAEKVFTPTETEGVVTLEFEIEPNKHLGKSLVAFETLYLNKVENGEGTGTVITEPVDNPNPQNSEENLKEVASHRDINSTEQTVTVPTKNHQTGQDIPWILIALGTVGLAALAYAVIARRKAKKDADATEEKEE